MCIIDYLLIAAIVLVVAGTLGAVLYYRQRRHDLNQDAVAVIDGSVFH